MIVTQNPDARLEINRLWRIARISRRIPAEWQSTFKTEVFDVHVDRLGFAVITVFDLARARQHWEVQDGYGQALMIGLRRAFGPEIGLILRQMARAGARLEEPGARAIDHPARATLGARAPDDHLARAGMIARSGEHAPAIIRCAELEDHA